MEVAVSFRGGAVGTNFNGTLMRDSLIYLILRTVHTSEWPIIHAVFESSVICQVYKGTSIM